VSVELSPEVIETDGLRQSLAEVFASHEEFEKFFAEVFSELDALSSELLRREHGRAEEQSHKEAELARWSEQLEADRSALATEREQFWAEIEQKQREGASQEGEGGDEYNDSLVRMLQEAEQERAAMRTSLESAQAQNERLVQVAEELSQAQNELGGAREEIARLRERLENAPEGSASQPDPELQAQIRQKEEERAQLDQERSVLENELDMVRNRAAEMAETLAQQQREMGEERQRWSAELKRMRRVLEALTTRQAEPQEASAPSGGQRGRAQPAEGMPELETVARDQPDPVLGSVMAQFEMLQKDIVRRRRDSAKLK
jgi:chromosome segregation ATPase